ncbi:SusD/RagB family nutrient-binding outer membrane lipoprotein [Vaginella massiliensis]|uniref:SusD/RagB family nutrient-binding outer membrane lipoprotein n=1 Tax=Vaginella massiliensis TaxID=1816680 RepID=UPI000838197E|nr:SusD/RagB family nutrient-binding outer membrane lipoprotein [Vaginella massiliensis]
MRKKINKIAVFGLLLLASSPMITSCTSDFEEINTNPNSPEVVPTYTIFNGATRHLMYNTRDGWWSGRMTLPWMQYSTQYNYLEEDKYQYRDSQTSNGWLNIYRDLMNFKDIILKAEDSSFNMELYGDIDNQIAASRIMMTYAFDQLVTHFGDVPYWSYSGRTNPNFQALDVDNYPRPVYATQQEIYENMLLELQEAAEQLNLNASVFSSGDNIYGGDAAKWYKFANSLRLRIANRVKAKIPSANTHITDAIAKGVFSSNDDNATLAFGSGSSQGSPFWGTFYVSSRIDFMVNNQFIKLLKGESAKNFGLDPRLFKYAAPKQASTLMNVQNPGLFQSYTESDNPADYEGMPYALTDDLLEDNQDLENTSFASKIVIKDTYAEVLMEYAEVEFILSEINGWSQANYINGVQASMDKWGVPAAQAAAYIAALPAANMENVLTQKYIAFYMQADQAWAEYRRTGYPNGNVLLLPGASTVDRNGNTYVFTPNQSGSVVATDLPDRVRYPITEASINQAAYRDAISKLSNGDEIDSKLLFSR